MTAEPVLNVGVTTTDPSQQASTEWWDIEVSTIWAEESLRRSWSYFAKVEPELRALLALLHDGDEFRRFAAPGTDRFGLASGFVIVRSGRAIATFALPAWTIIDRLTADLANKSWLRHSVSPDTIPGDLLRDVETLKRLLPHNEFTVQHAAALKETTDKDVAQWKAMLSLMQPGDEIRRYDNGGWADLCGSAGYALVRNGEVIASFQTLMN